VAATVSSQDKPTDSDGWMRAMVRFFASFDRTGSASASAAELGLNRHTCQGWVRAAGLRSREGDLIIGADGASAIGILVERVTRYGMLIHLPAGRTAEAVRDQLVATMTPLPDHLRGSLPWEQGAELAAHRSFTVATHRPAYFCDPASPGSGAATRHERAAPPVLPQGHRPLPARAGRPRTRRPATQRPTT
jgi:hypothetical protein